MNVEPGSVVGQRYRLDEPLAEGGMGSVWRATHVQLGTPVAVKFMLEDLADISSARTRFEREARAAARLRSPHVVDVVDYGIEGGMPYLAMELLEGEDLATRIRARSRLTPGETLPIVEGVAKALDLAHGEGFLHRDLKPRNIFLAQVAGEEVVKVLDFGLAKALEPSADEEATTTGLLMGSPGYMSPEQARGAELDGRSDLWSLAVVIFCAVTGKRPFRGKNPGDIIAQICADRLPVPSDYHPELTQAIDRFFLRGFARNPTRRFQTGAELAEAFAAAADGEAIDLVDDAATVDEGPRGRDEPTGALPSAPGGSAPEQTSPEHGVALWARPSPDTPAPRPRADTQAGITTRELSPAAATDEASLASISTPAVERASRPRRGIWLLALALAGAVMVMLLRVDGSSEDPDGSYDPPREVPPADEPIPAAIPAPPPSASTSAAPSTRTSASAAPTPPPPPAVRPRPVLPRPAPRPEPTCDPFSGLCR